MTTPQSNGKAKNRQRSKANGNSNGGKPPPRRQRRQPGANVARARAPMRQMDGDSYQSALGLRVAVPSAFGRVQLGSGPKFLRSSDPSRGSIRIARREFVTEVTSPSSFWNVFLNLSINPGISATFPWLSGLGKKFESYRFRRLDFYFMTEAPSTASTNCLMMALDFDAADAAPESKQQLMAYQSYARSPVWQDCFLCPVQGDLHKLGPERYIRTGTVSGTDIKTYDVANLYVGAQVSGTFGELHVDYDVEFFTPQFNPGDEAVASSVKLTANGTVAAATPFGTSAPTLVGGLVVGPTSAGTGLGFSTQGDYLVSVESTGTVFTDTLPVLTAVSPNTVSAISTALNHNTAATLATYQFIVKVKQTSTFSSGFASANAFTLSYAADSTTYTASVVRVAIYGYSNA